MVHDIEASWAAVEIARDFKISPSNCFSAPPPPSSLSTFPSRQGRKTWPVADGVILIEDKKNSYNIALEFKRPNEGVHGILTAIGQSLAYVEMGFSASVIVVPKSYETLKNPGEYIKKVLDHSCMGMPIGVFTYEKPDTSVPSPFESKMKCERPLQLDKVILKSKVPSHTKTETQWAHLREGSSFPDAFYRYLQISKRLAVEENIMPDLDKLPKDLKLAVQSIASQDVFKYLSNSVGDSFHDRVWRYFWFTYIFTPEVAPLWKIPAGSIYEINESPTRLLRHDGKNKMQFFQGRSDSIKSKLIKKLNDGSINEENAWKEYAKNVHDRAHSLREDIDSGLFHIGLLTDDGRPTDLGYRFVDSCERSGDANTGTPKSIMGFAILRNGQLEAFLHYIYRLSEEKFKSNPLDFTVGRGSKIDQNKYLKWLESELANRLGVIRKVSPRGGTARKPFQAELAILRKFDFVKDFRVGVGLEINWPEVQNALEFHH